MPSQVCLVFYGEILPGFAPDQVKNNLASLLGIDPQQVTRVFSGQRIVLKSGVPETEAARYVDHLNRLGARVLVEPLTPAAAPVKGVVAPVPPPPVVPAASADTTCPVCGEVQPKRSLCRKCGANMAEIRAARANAEAEAALLREAEEEVRARNGGRLDRDDGNAPPKILSFNFSGRMGRMSYLLANFLISPIMLVLLLIALRDNNMALVAAALILPAIINLRASVLRCHDLNFSGWWVLLSLLPWVGLLFWLVLLVAPGTSSMNTYGDIPGRTPGKQVLAGFAMSVVVAALTVPRLVGEVLRLTGEGRPQAAAANKDEAAPPVAPSRPAPQATAPAGATAATAEGGRKSYDGSINAILIYSVGDCVPCTERRGELTRIGLWPREVRVDLNEPAADEMVAKLVKAGLPVSSMQMPVIDVNGTVLNNPSVEQVEKHLR